MEAVTGDYFISEGESLLGSSVAFPFGTFLFWLQNKRRLEPNLRNIDFGEVYLRELYVDLRKLKGRTVFMSL